VITVAFGFSLAALHACNLIEGRAVFFEDINGTQLPPDTNPQLVAEREYPGILDAREFTLGVFKANDEWNSTFPGSKCVAYANAITDDWLDAGPAEGSAGFFGTLAAALGGLSMVVFFGLAATDTKKKWYNMVFSGILFFAAISQVLIFTLFSSSHCGDQFWADFLSLQEQQEESASTTCEMGTGGWFAIVAFVLFLFSALLVATKWLNPGYKLFTMEWTKDHTGDPGRIQRTGNDEEAGNRQLQSTEAKELLPPVIEQTMTDEEDDEHHEYHHGGNKPDPSMMVNY